MVTVFIEGDPKLQKSGAEAARELADLHYPSLLEATGSRLASPTSTEPR
jgi:hypothetical protein